MMKYALLVAVVVAVAQAQRPWYAGSGTGSQVHPRFLTTTTADPAGTTTNVDSVTDLVSRIGENAPYDPYNDEELINRIKTWPKENQPFWFLNRDAIKEHLSG